MKILLKEQPTKLIEDEYKESKTINITKIHIGGILLGVFLCYQLSYLLDITLFDNELNFRVYKKVYLFLLIFPLHELLHAALFPNYKKSVIGFSIKKFVFYADYDGELSKYQIMKVCLAPLFILTLLPLLFLLVYKNSLIAYIVLFNLLGSGYDIILYFIMLKQPSNRLFKFANSKVFYKDQ